MNILLIHQNFPGQYRQFLDWLIATGKHNIVFLTQRKGVPEINGAKVIRYEPDHKPADDAYALSSYFESCSAAGYKVAILCRQLEADGFKPDVAIGHCGWGEMLFLKDVWPDLPVMSLFEYFFTAEGGLIGFDPEFPASPNAPFITRARNAVHYMSYGLCDAGTSATQWQLDTYPKMFHDKVKAIHEGIVTSSLVPNHTTTVKLGRVDEPVGRNHEVFTYMARNLEPARGFHQFMRALPIIQKLRPHARAIVIGGSGVSYGQKSDDKGGFRGRMEQEVATKLDWDRIHFVGQVPYETYVKTIQLSRCHIYLTAPFVLSWSLLEAMSMGATVVASDTAPVREVMEDGKTGFLIDFFSPEALAEKVADVLAHKDNYRRIGEAARRHVVANYDFRTACLPKYLNHLNGILPRQHHMLVDD